MWCIYVFFPRLPTAAGEFALYIDVGLSALLVSTERAMREPQHVERAAVLGSTFFFGRCIISLSLLCISPEPPMHIGTLLAL